MKFRLACTGFGAMLLLAALGIGINAREGATAQSSAGDIAGKVNFHGNPPQLRPILMTKDPVCVSEQSGAVLPEDGRVNANGTLPNAFVYISKSSGNLAALPATSTVRLTQKGCRYEPHVLGIEVGQKLDVVSEDATTHNIHVTPKMGRDWNVTQQPGSEPVSMKFTHPEIMVPVHCNVHNWMQAYIGVVSNPYYAVTGDDGSFAINGVPPGEYTVSVWTATFGTQERQVSVGAGKTAMADFTFEPK